MNYIFSIDFSTSGRNAVLIGDNLIGADLYSSELKELRAYLNYVYTAASADIDQNETSRLKRGRLSFKLSKSLSDQYFTAAIEALDDEEVGVITTWELEYLIRKLDEAIKLVDYLDMKVDSFEFEDKLL